MFWKFVPAKTFTQKQVKSMPVYKVFKDRIAVLLWGNVAGYKLKPPVIRHSERAPGPSSMSLSTYCQCYRDNKVSQMTQFLFQAAFLNCYARKMEQYCLKNSKPFKILLTKFT